MIKRFKEKSEDRYKELKSQYNSKKNSSFRLRTKSDNKKKTENPNDYKKYLEDNYNNIKNVFLKEPYRNVNFKITNTVKNISFPKIPRLNYNKFIKQDFTNCFDENKIHREVMRDKNKNFSSLKNNKNKMEDFRYKDMKKTNPLSALRPIILINNKK